MNAKQQRRLAQAEQRLAAARSTPNSAVLLAWLASETAQQTLVSAAAGEPYEVSDDVRSAGLAMRKVLSKRLDASSIASMTRAELAALVVSGAASAP